MSNVETAERIATLEAGHEHHGHALEHGRARVDSLELRTTALERWRFYMTGALALLGVQFTTAVTIGLAIWRARSGS